MSFPFLVSTGSTIALSLMGVAILLAVVRLIRGPSLPDRVVALDLISILVAGTTAIYAVATGETVFLDVAIDSRFDCVPRNRRLRALYRKAGCSMSEVLSTVLMIMGAAFALLAGAGVVRMPDLFMRMQAATKASTLGIGFILLAVAVYFGELGITTRALATITFVFLTRRSLRI